MCVCVAEGVFFLEVVFVVFLCELEEELEEEVFTDVLLLSNLSFVLSSDLEAILL